MFSEELSLVNSLNVSAGADARAGLGEKTHKQSLSLMVREEKEDLEAEPRPKPLDLQRVDFMGPANAFKSIFSLQQPQKSQSSRKGQQQRNIKGEIFAVHKLGNAIIVDSIPDCDSSVLDSDSSDSIASRRLLGMNQDGSGTETERARTLELAMALNTSAETLLGHIPTSSSSAIHPLSSLSSPLAPLPSSILAAASTVASTTTMTLDNSSLSALLDDESQSLQEGSPHTPPAAYFMPSYPSPGQRTLNWQFSDLQMVNKLPIHITRRYYIIRSPVYNLNPFIRRFSRQTMSYIIRISSLQVFR